MKNHMSLVLRLGSGGAMPWRLARGAPEVVEGGWRRSGHEHVRRGRRKNLEEGL